MDSSKRVVIVTGGTTGIGKAISEKFLANDDFVITNYYYAEEKTDQFLNEQWAQGRNNLEAYKASVCDFQAIAEMFKYIYSKYGKIDVLVNNAGIIKKEFNVTCKNEDWAEIIDVNINSLYNNVKNVLPYMIERKYGKIINISSVTAFSSVMTMNSAYSATKAGILGFTRVIAKEVIKSGINVNAISPGFVETEMLNLFTPEELNKIKNMIPIKRFAKPEEIASLVFFLASDQSSYIVGENIAIEGGLTA